MSKVANGVSTYTIEEVGRLFGLARGSAYEAAKRGDFPTVRIGRRLLVPKAAIDAALESGESQPENKIVGRPPIIKADEVISFRIDNRLKASLLESAELADRSLSAEITLRLQHSICTIKALRVSIAVEE